MADTIRFNCPLCDGALAVPGTAAGKRAKCKHCGEVIPIPGGAKPVAQAPPKPAPPPPPPPPPAVDANAPLKFKDDEEDDDTANPYGVIKDSDVPRCPHCANELDPPDTKVCLTCGYDLQTRQRHKSRKVYETTAQDYFSYILPAVVWIVVLLALIGVDIAFWTNMEEWMTGGMLDQDTPNPATKRPTFIVGPNCFNVFFTVFLVFMLFLGGRVIVDKFIRNPKPPEVEKVKGEDDEDEDDDEEDDEDEDEDDEDDEEEDEPPRKKRR